MSIEEVKTWGEGGKPTVHLLYSIICIYSKKHLLHVPGINHLQIKINIFF